MDLVILNFTDYNLSSGMGLNATANIQCYQFIPELGLSSFWFPPPAQKPVGGPAMMNYLWV